MESEFTLLPAALLSVDVRDDGKTLAFVMLIGTKQYEFTATIEDMHYLQIRMICFDGEFSRKFCVMGGRNGDSLRQISEVIRRMSNGESVELPMDVGPYRVDE